MTHLSVAAMLAGMATICAGCSDNAQLPPQIAFGDHLLEQKSHDTDGRISRTTFAAADARLPDAPLQVEVHVGDDVSSVEELHESVMDRYRATPGLRPYYVQSHPNRACAVAARQAPARSFVLLDFCSNADGRTACAQAVEKLGDDDVSECAAKGGACWNAFCEAQWDAWRESLRRVAGTAGRAYSREGN